MLVSAHGAKALSVRAVADEVGTTTRAIYSLFGSKDGLIAALGARAFELLGAAVQGLPVTEDAASDLIDCGVLGFRRLFLDHPALFRVGIQRIEVPPEQLATIRDAAAEAWAALAARVLRVKQQNGLGTLDPHEAATAFHALCEGLAVLELRGFVQALSAEGQWRRALGALVHGFTLEPAES